MDYTTAPRPLIYRERRSLEEFGIYEEECIMRPLSDAIFEFDFIRAPNAEDRALWCMNNAFYICTMFFLERDPKWRYDKYKKIAIPERNNLPTELQYVTLSLVGLLLSRLEDPIPLLSDKGKVRNSFVMSMLSNEEKKYIFNDLSKSLESVFKHKCIPNSTFAPRDINAETVHDVLMDDNFNWVKFTNYWEERKLKDIVKAFGTKEEEKHHVVDILRQTSRGFYAKGFRCEQVDDLLDNLDTEIRSQYNPEAPYTTNESDVAGNEIKTDASSSETHFKEVEELNTKVRSLQSELEKVNKIVEEYRQPVKELTAKQKIRMEFAVQLFLQSGLTEEKLESSKTKVASLLSLLLNIRSNNDRNRPEQICSNFLTYRKYYPQTKDKATILELDRLCAELGIIAYLSTEPQGNKKV